MWENVVTKTNGKLGSDIPSLPSCQSYAKCSQWAGQGRSRKPKINEPDDILIFDSKILLTGQTVILRVQLCTQRQNNVVSQMVKSISSYKVQFVTKY